MPTDIWRLHYMFLHCCSGHSADVSGSSWNKPVVQGYIKISVRLACLNLFRDICGHMLTLPAACAIISEGGGSMPYTIENNQTNIPCGPGTFAKLIGVSVKTLQRWDKSGSLVAGRLPSGRRFYTSGHYASCGGDPTVFGKLVSDLGAGPVDQKEVDGDAR